MNKWKPLKVLFIGDEPSSRNVCQNVPFVGTSSYKRLLKWIGELDLDIRTVDISNASDYVVEFKIIILGLLNQNIQTSPPTAYDKIIVLGSKAYAKLPFELKTIPKYNDIIKIIDHPSPRNRKFNDPRYEKKMLKELKGWLYDT